MMPRFRFARALALILAGALTPSAVRAAEPPVQPLVVDTTYAPLLEDSGGGIVTSAILRDDNHAVIGGTFEFVNDTAQRYLTALQIDGSIDPGFAAAGGPDGPVFALVERADGAMLAGGAFRRFAEKPAAGLVGLRADGSIDPSFATPTRVNGTITVLTRLPDGKFLIGGSFSFFGDAAAPGLVRLLPDGTRDDSFQPAIGMADRHTTVVSIAALADGDYAVVATYSATAFEPLDRPAWPASGLPETTSVLIRLRADGSADPDFKLQRTTGLEPAVVAALPSGGLILAGSGEMQRINADGTVDGRFRFQEQGKMQVRSILPLDDDHILVAGHNWGDATLTARLLVVGRIGWIETRFVMPRDEHHAFFALARNQRGRVLAAGRVSPAVERLSFSKTENRVLLLDEKFAIDRRFRAHVGAAGQFSAAALDGRGGLTLAGSFKSSEGLSGTSIVRLQPDGSHDRVFAPRGELYGRPHILVPIPDGGVVAGGIVHAGIAIRNPRPVIRLRGDGTAFDGFIPDVPVGGHFTDGKLLSDGTVVLVGSLAGRTPDRNFADLIRFNLAGKVDRKLAETVPSWFSSTAGRLLAISETVSGHLLVAGEFQRVQNYPRSAIARVGSIGVVDPAFKPETDDFAVVASIIPLNDRRIFIDGWAKPAPGRPISRRWARILIDGPRDSTYSPPTDFGDREGLLACVLADGTTLVVLQDFAPDAEAHFRLARLDRDGSVMPGFNVTLGNHARDLRILPYGDGSVYLVGDVASINGAPRHGIARLVRQR